MKLYGVMRSPFVARVRLALAHKGIDAALIPPPGGPGSEAYRAINPMGQIPALHCETGAIVPDSAAIIEYLEDRYPEPSLRPENLADRARARLFLRVPDIQFAGAPRTLIAMRKPEDRQSEAIDAAFATIARALSAIDTFLDDDAGPWAIGGKVSIADCAIVPVLNVVTLVSRVHERDPIGDLPRLAHYWQSAQADPVNAAVLAEQRADATAAFA